MINVLKQKSKKFFFFFSLIIIILAFLTFFNPAKEIIFQILKNNLVKEVKDIKSIELKYKDD